MKQRISIAVDEATLNLVDKALKNKAFRNRSHAIELMIIKALEKTGDGEEK